MNTNQYILYLQRKIPLNHEIFIIFLGKNSNQRFFFQHPRNISKKITRNCTGETARGRKASKNRRERESLNVI